MGKLFGSTKQKTTTKPWSAQQPYLRTGFREGRDALNDALGTPAYDGDFVAGMNNMQNDALGATYDHFMTRSPEIGGQLADAGLSNTGVSANFGANANNLLAQAGMDPTQRTLDNAGRYADNPYIQNLIDSSLKDVNKAFGLELQGINAGASGTGNINSTRTGVVEAAARDDAMDRAAQISSGIRSAAFDNGLNLAATQGQQGILNQLAANQQIAGAGALGVDQTVAGENITGSGYQTAIGVGNQYQQQDQNEIQGALQADQYGTNRDLDLISKYMAAINGNYGGTTTTPGASPFQQILGGAAQVAGIYSGFSCWVAREVYGVDDPRWKQFRVWVVYRSPNWFYRLYNRHGEKAAAFVRKVPCLKPLIRGLMNLVISRRP